MRLLLAGGSGFLGTAWRDHLARHGHEVVVGTRDPERAEVAALVQRTGATAAVDAEAARGADLVLLAVKGDAARAAVRALDLADGQVLVDVTNPLTSGADGPAPRRRAAPGRPRGSSRSA